MLKSWMKKYHPEVRHEGREPLLDKAGGSPSCRDQEWRRGSNEVVPGTSVFPFSETGILGNFWGRIKGAKYRFVLQDGTWEGLGAGGEGDDRG